VIYRKNQAWQYYFYIKKPETTLYEWNHAVFLPFQLEKKPHEVIL
jgi:hypothetical protein